MTFGSGVPLREFSPYLRDEDKRIAIIVDVAERDSVIEGLPPFTEEFKKEMIEKLKKKS